VPHRKIHWITLQNPRFGRPFGALAGSDSISDRSFSFPFPRPSPVDISKPDFELSRQPPKVFAEGSRDSKPGKDRDLHSV
jgi:hypothetical protein